MILLRITSTLALSYSTPPFSLHSDKRPSTQQDIHRLRQRRRTSQRRWQDTTKTRQDFGGVEARCLADSDRRPAGQVLTLSVPIAHKTRIRGGAGWYLLLLANTPT